MDEHEERARAHARTVPLSTVYVGAAETGARVGEAVARVGDTLGAALVYMAVVYCMVGVLCVWRVSM